VITALRNGGGRAEGLKRWDRSLLGCCSGPHTQPDFSNPKTFLEETIGTQQHLLLFISVAAGEL
jgi:hypothetical protein